MPKHRSFNLGQLGVNVREGPLHVQDGEFTRAQNAELLRDGLDEGIAKRRGISLFSPDGLGAAIVALTSIPLPDPFVPYPDAGDVLYALTTTDGGAIDYYQTTEDGTTWEAGVSETIPLKFLFPSGITHGSIVVFQHGGPLVTEDGVHFLDAVVGHLVRWNGNTLTTLTANEISDVSSMTVCHTLLLHDGDIYAVGDAGTATSICRFTGTGWEEAVSVASWAAAAAASAFGRLYVPSTGQRMGYWSADSGWVDEGIFTGNVGGTMPVMDLVQTSWGLVAALVRNGQDAELLWLRPGPDDAWVDITPAGNTTGCWGPMAILDDVLYIARHADPVAPTFAGCEVWQYAGGTVTLDEDLTALVTNASWVLAMVAFNDALYLTVRATTDPSNNIVRRSAGGTYAVVVAEDGISQAAPAGPLGFF